MFRFVGARKKKRRKEQIPPEKKKTIYTYKELADLRGTLRAKAERLGGISEAGNLVVALLDNDERDNRHVGAENAATDLKKYNERVSLFFFLLPMLRFRSRCCRTDLRLRSPARRGR